MYRRKEEPMGMTWPVPTWSDTDLNYLAGYLDGEGCFSCETSVRLYVLNTHRPTIEWIQRTFGGRIRFNIPRKNTRHRPLHRWTLNGKQAALLAMSLIPFLKEKQEQACLLSMAFFTFISMKGRGHAPTEAMLCEREKLKNALKESHHVSWT